MRSSGVELRQKIRCLSALSECGDASCGCYRLGRHGDARLVFSTAVGLECLRRFPSAESRQGAALRYASVGCGLLLSDWEVVTRVLGCKFAFESLDLVDTLFAAGSTIRSRASRVSSPEGPPGDTHVRRERERGAARRLARDREIILPF